MLPAGFRCPTFAGGVYLPFVPDAKRAARDSHFLQVVGRLAPGATLAQARAELDTIARALAATYPDSNKDRSVLIRSWQESLTAQLRPAILLLFGAVLLVLVIACANVANMLLARAAARAGRAGACAWRSAPAAARVVQQLLTECLLLALLGGIAGTGAWRCGASTPRARCCAPAACSSRRSTGARSCFAGARRARQHLRLRPGARAARLARRSGGGGQGRRAQRHRRALAAARDAGGRCRWRCRSRCSSARRCSGAAFCAWPASSPGFDPHGVVTLQMSLPDSKEPVPFYARVLERVQALPEVTHAGITDFLPLSQSNINGGFDIEGKSSTIPTATPST